MPGLEAAVEFVEALPAFPRDAVAEVLLPPFSHGTRRRGNPGGCAAGEEALFGAGGLAGAGAAHELVEGLCEVRFVDVGIDMAAGGGTQVLPDAFVEQAVDVVAVDPWHFDELPVRQPDPHLAAVVGVLVDLPLPASCHHSRGPSPGQGPDDRRCGGRCGSPGR